MRRSTSPAWEKAQIVCLEVPGLRRAAAGIEHQPDIDAGIARLRENARKRAEKSK
ncbi:hypothetical protein [Streptomyces sp. NPDC002573]|uniref:hypothetical protein n=1 Tax=Streptomyces sp. NPDC002573 TaxID=3364651 RepID=UPI0036A03816